MAWRILTPVLSPQARPRLLPGLRGPRDDAVSASRPRRDQHRQLRPPSGPEQQGVSDRPRTIRLPARFAGGGRRERPAALGRPRRGRRRRRNHELERLSEQAAMMMVIGCVLSTNM